jgi:uncharacterized protein (UPF0332 family)
MADLRQTRTMQLGKIRNLIASAGINLKDARAPAQVISAPRRNDAAYDAAFCCALALLEANKMEVTSDLGHHRLVLEYFVDTLSIKGSVRDAIPAVIRNRNAYRYDGALNIDETTVVRTIQWAELVMQHTAGWFEKNLPQALKS